MHIWLPFYTVGASVQLVLTLIGSCVGKLIRWPYLMSFISLSQVPDNVFASDFVWKGSYDYKGQKQPMTLTVRSFNATTGKVNVTLTDSSMEFLLSGESSINHTSAASCSHYLCVSLQFILRMPHVNQSITKWSHACEWKLTIGCKGGCISLRWLTHCPPKSHSSPHVAATFLSVLSLTSVLPLFSTSYLFHRTHIASSLLFFTSIPVLPLVLTQPVGVYKRQEARLMLLLHQMRALAHSSLSRITDETWAMDGFVSIHSHLKNKQELWLSIFIHLLFVNSDKSSGMSHPKAFLGLFKANV